MTTLDGRQRAELRRVAEGDARYRYDAGQRRSALRNVGKSGRGRHTDEGAELPFRDYPRDGFRLPGTAHDGGGTHKHSVERRVQGTRRD